MTFVLHMRRVLTFKQKTGIIRDFYFTESVGQFIWKSRWLDWRILPCGTPGYCAMLVLTQHFRLFLVFFWGYDQCCLLNLGNEDRVTQIESGRDIPTKEPGHACNTYSTKAVEKKKAAGKKPQVCIVYYSNCLYSFPILSAILNIKTFKFVATLNIKTFKLVAILQSNDPLGSLLLRILFLTKTIYLCSNPSSINWISQCWGDKGSGNQFSWG